MRRLPYVLALLFALWSLNGLESGTVVDTDAARHAMNGVFLHDMVREGQLVNAIEYARSYYGRYPALSLPYHPPLFPALESLFFFLFGVNLLAARLAVALAAGLSVLLFYRLVLATHASHAVAVVSVLLFFSLPSVQYVTHDVMLELPTLAFTLGALWFLRDLHQGFPLRRGIAFALLGAAAVWTKQNALFLGLVPFVLVVLLWRWRLLLDKTIWIASVLFGSLVVALLAASTLSGLGGNEGWPDSGPVQVFLYNVPYYAAAMRRELGLAPLLLLGAAVIWAFGRLRRRDAAAAGSGNALYLAWALAVFLVLWFLPPFDFRYLFFAYPALAVVGGAALVRIGERLPMRQAAWAAPVAIAIAWSAVQVSSSPISFVRGPSEAAQTVAVGSPSRVLYCGRSNGHFIFALRSLEPGPGAVVIRGDKLPASIFEPVEFERFAHDYGVTHVVLERRPAKNAWDLLFASPTRSLELVSEIPLVSSDPNLTGDLRVFRFTNPSPEPSSALKLRMQSGRELEISF